MNLSVECKSTIIDRVMELCLAKESLMEEDDKKTPLLSKKYGVPIPIVMRKERVPGYSEKPSLAEVIIEK